MNSTPLQRAIQRTIEAMESCGRRVHTEKWQGMDISAKPDMEMVEVLGHNFMVQLDTEDLDSYRSQIAPNLPWADDHFLERVAGQPLNPGIQWQNWPFSKSADRFRNLDAQFTHTYMERYWPKFAGFTDDGHLPPGSPKKQNFGYRFQVGDLNDVVALLAREPDTRQAFLPVWFPEDTGVIHGGRVPCSIGYHFIVRNGYLHTTYWLRSCDLVRHFRDDIYLTIRLTLWILERLRLRFPGSAWGDVKPGYFQMFMTSLHMFVNDYRNIFRRSPP